MSNKGMLLLCRDVNRCISATTALIGVGIPYARVFLLNFKPQFVWQYDAQFLTNFQLLNRKGWCVKYFTHDYVNFDLKKSCY